MKISRIAGIAALLAAGALQAQTVKVDGIVEAWYTQMLDNNLRLNKTTGSYATNSIPAPFLENTFYIRRTEIHFNGTITDDVTWNAIIDPNTATTTAPSPLLDASINWKLAPDFSIKVGQFKPGITLDSNTGGAGLYFYDRSMMARQWGEKRDRGIMATYTTGDPKAFSAKLNFGIFNGMADKDAKSNDTSAQKDYMFRLDMAYGKDHKFAVYYREGETDVKAAGMVAGTATAWGAGAPSATVITDNMDKTTNLGAFYVYDTATWHADADVMTGLLGRRYPTVFNPTAAAVGREHLNQKFMGIVLSGAYKMGQHWITARYDSLNYNQGNDWYTATNPYTTDTTTGLATGVDRSPKFTEMILGYNYLFNPTKYAAGKMKVDYIHRSKNFFMPRADQTGEQGGDSVVVSFQIGF
jgi:hypothetical protein